MQTREAPSSPSPAEEPSKMLVRVKRAADILDVSERTVWNLLEQGLLDGVSIGRSRRIPMTSIQRFVEARMQQSA